MAKTAIEMVEKAGINIDELLKLLRAEDIDFTREGTGILFTIPVGMAVKPEKGV